MDMYKKESEVLVSVDITDVSSLNNGELYWKFDFSADCGKFGTDEQLASFEFTPRELLDLFSKLSEPPIK